MGTWNKDRGIYISISSSTICGTNVLYRSIKHIKDYAGGPNCWLKESLFIRDYDEALSRLNSLKNKNKRVPV
jgi:hypothetical protein